MYKTSTFRKSFEKEIVFLKNTCLTAHKNHVSYNHDLRQLVFQSFFFRSCALLENYIIQIIENWVFEIKKNNLSITTLPEESRMFFILKQIEDIVKQYILLSDETRVFRRLSSQYNTLNTITSGVTIPQPISGRSIISQKSFPSIDNLSKVFGRMGVKFKTEINATAKRDALLILQSFLDLRNEIAHEHPRSLAYSDIVRNHDNLKKVISYLDRMFYKIISNNSNSIGWSI